ncbi:biopolymer transporter ExbD [Roseibium sp. Sym1]|uniref:biopolymer transporter ExbD n=1 Tax=Roseibium sp. Sym1 TaxID=3016006 RepID=UPI0022B47ED6|nr:biopolymer transporter ExbD [Roseibium sp. Sym1]
MKRYTKPIHLQELIPHRRADSSLALINVVFLLLLFLVVSGTLRPPLPDGFDWAETTQGEGASSIQGGLVLTLDGGVWVDGSRVEREELNKYLAEAARSSDRLTVQVDKRARMEFVAALAKQARSSGLTALTLVTVQADGP